MGLLSKINQMMPGGDDDDLEREDDAGRESEDFDNEDGRIAGGILTRLVGKLKGGGELDIDQDDDDGQSSADDDDQPVQRVQLEGVPDVHPVGDSSAELAAVEESEGSTVAAGRTDREPSNAGTTQSQTADSPSQAESAQELAADAADELPPADNGETVDGSKANDLDVSLKDIFEEQSEIDVNLKDLADTTDDVAAAEVASELRDFLAELET